MSNTESLQLFEDQPIRSAWDEEAEEWYFSIVDVVGVLTEQPDARHASTYWAVLKKRLNEEGASELLTNCKQLKLKASDGKRRATDVANTEQLLRIIQSIPSKKAEPFKLWLAQVGRERIEETLDPELIADRLVSTYERAGYTREWINQRLQAISARKELTDEWKVRGVQQGKEYAILTDELTRAWSGMTTRQYKKLKGLKKQSHRDENKKEVPPIAIPNHHIPTCACPSVSMISLFSVSSTVLLIHIRSASTRHPWQMTRTPACTARPST